MSVDHQENVESLLGVFNLGYFSDLSPDLICVAGYDGYFKRINPAVSKTLGYSDAELFARPIDTFVHPLDQQLTSSKRENIKKGKALLNFENRYLTKTGAIVWLSWTSVRIEKEQVIFAIAKNITQKMKVDREDASLATDLFNININASNSDRNWLIDFEALVKKQIGKTEIHLSSLSIAMGVSERQLHRHINKITGLSPNKYIRLIRLQIAKAAIDSGNYRTVAEISYAAGFDTPAYFNKLFKAAFGKAVGDFL